MSENLVTEMARRLATLIALKTSLDANYREVVEATYPWTKLVKQGELA